MEYENPYIREAIKPPTISNMELFVKTKSFIENLKDVEINVRIGMFDSNYVEWEGGNKFTIAIQSPPKNGIAEDIAFYHEISHIVFDSLVGQAHRMARDWSIQFEDKYQSFAEQMWLGAFNLLEDTRIESQWGSIYAGTDRKFIETRNMLGKSLPANQFDNPLYSLQGARMFRDDLVFKGHEMAIQVMKDVENTSLEGSIILASRYADKIIKPYIDQKIKKEEEDKEKIRKKAEKDLDKLKMPEMKPVPTPMERPSQAEFNSMKEEDRKQTMEKIKEDNQKIREVKRENEIKQNKFNSTLKSIKRTAINKIDQQESRTNRSLRIEKVNSMEIAGKDHNSFLEKQKIDNSKETPIDMKSNVADLKARGNEESKAVINAINDQNAKKIIKGAELESVIGQKVLNVQRPEGIVRENKMITKWIEKTFKAIANKPKERIEDFGNSVSIPHLIRARARGFGAFYKNTRKQRSIAVLLMVDGSGSMRVPSEITNSEGYNLTRFDVMRDLTASIFDPLDKIKNIDFRACIWSGSRRGELTITNIDKKEDIKQITKSDNYLTPTHLALAYGGKYLAKMRGKDKYIIMMTDGVPEHNGKELGESIDKMALIKAAQKECKAIKGRGNKVMGIFLGNNDQELIMKKIFGGSYVRCTTMEEVQTATLKKMKRILVGNG